MKTKKIATLILSCVMVLFAAFAIGCKGKNDNTANKTVNDITLSNTTAEIKAGGEIAYADYTVTANYSDGSNKVVPLTEKMFKAEDLAKFENDGTYEIEVSAFGKTALLTVTVTNYDFEGVTANNVNAVYDGTAKVPTLENAPAGVTVVWTYYAGTDKTGAVVNEAVNAGSYYAEGVVSLKYYNDVTVNANVVIAKKTVDPASLNWSNLKRVYTGSAINANVTATDLPEGVTVAYEGDGKTGTSVGKYTVTVKFDDTNSVNYNMSAETYDVEWEIIAPLDATWFGAENGALYVADFKSNSETAGTLTFNGQTTTYTVAFDDKGNATFSGLNGNVTAISLKGGILRLTAGEKNYLLVNKDDLNTYFAGNEYDMLLAQFRIDLNETDKTLKLFITTDADGEQEYPLTMTAGDSETLAKNVKLSVSETLYLDYYYSYGVRINGFENPNGYKSESYYVLATKSAVAAALKNIVDGEFKDLDGNTLVINGYDDIKYNGRAVELYAVNSYGKVSLCAAINSGKTNAELAPNAGYIKFNSSSFYDKNLIVKAGTYYLEKDGTISDAETFGFLTSSYYYTVTTKLLNGEAAESKTFTVNGAETADRALLTLEKDGQLTVTCYLKNETEVYATFVVNANGTAVTYGEKAFKKVEKLIEKATGYPSSKYYGANGTVLTYDGKGLFTFTDANGSKEYNKYTLEVDGDKLTINLVNGEDTCTIVSEDPRYITVDGKVYLNERSSNLTNGYSLSATFIAGDSQIVIKNNVVTLDGNALTDLEFSFVDDGNNNGRTVLQIKGKKDAADETYVTVLYYSLAAVKVGNKGYAIQLLSPYYGVTYRPVEDETKSFTFETDGRLMINGKEVFVSVVGNSNIKYYIENGNALLECTMYDNSSYGYATVNEGGVQYDYNSDFFMEYRGLYVSDDNASVFAYLKSDTIYASETSYTRCSVNTIDENGTVLNVGSKKATLKTVDGQHIIEYDGKTYNQVKDFSLDAYYGTYSVLNGNNYDSLTVPSNLLSARDVELIKFVMYNGSYTPVIEYNSWNKAYLIKNTDSATANALPYYAISESYLKYAGDGKLDGKAFEISFGVGTKDNKKVPVMNVLYDGKAVTLTDIKTFQLTANINGKDYTVEAVTGDEKAYADLMIYESVYGKYKGSYLFNGNVGELAIKVNEDGESVIVLKFNDNEVNATFADASFGKTVTFAYNGVNYKGNLVEANPSVRIVTLAEYEFFFGSPYVEDEAAYNVTVNGKTIKFDYEIKSLSRNYSDYQFAFKSLNYDGKAATATYYANAAQTVVFTTEDGTYAYNLATKALTANVTFDGIKALIYDKNVSNGDVYVTARITAIDGSTAKVGLFYDLGDKGGLKAVTATAVEGGYKLTGEGLATTYLLEEGDAYALYTEEQYLLVGTFEIGDKNLVITGTHENGKFTYTAAYDGAEAVAVTPDFTAKSIKLTSEGGANLFTWTLNDGKLSFTLMVIPASALKFELGDTFMSNLNETYTKLFVKIEFKGVDTDGKIKFNVNWKRSSYGNYSVADGTLSEDGTYIMANVYYDDLYIYLNATKDDYYDYVAIKANRNTEAKKYIGTFLDGNLKIELAATSTDDDDEPKYKESWLQITYNGKTAKADYSTTVTDGIEFTVDGKTYVAKLVDGAMTVTEKAAA